MSWFAHLMYAALVWKEHQRARRSRCESLEIAHEDGHLQVGERGETLAYWFLRQAGYTIIARNRRSRSGAGELDLVGYDGPILAFIEVKTRTSGVAGPPETAVSGGKQKRIARAAKEYLRRMKRRPENYRFDIVSVAWDPTTGLSPRLIKDAFKVRGGS
jgi:putative endonuclease